VEINKEILKIQYKEIQVFYLKNGNAYLGILLPMNTEQIEVIEYKLQENNIKVV
jgi:hypothetical protein